jgi:RNA recognition motif-containing protein
MAHHGYGFCEFLTEEDAEYACKVMNQIKLWGKPIRVNKVRLSSSTQFLILVLPSLCYSVSSHFSSADSPLDSGFLG